MPDRIVLPVLALIAAGLIALAMVWPQGQGAQSPAPFGHPLAALPASPPPPAAKAEPKPTIQP
jgi:hypothetical protein